MRKSSIKFHAKRSSGRKAKAYGGGTSDACALAHQVVSDKGVQIQQNYTLARVLQLLGQFWLPRNTGQFWVGNVPHMGRRDSENYRYGDVGQYSFQPRVQRGYIAEVFA